MQSYAGPMTQHNLIYNGKCSGIACLGNGEGVFRENNIYNNNATGVYSVQRECPKAILINILS